MMDQELQYQFDENRANIAVSFIETQCHHVKGEHAGKPLILEDFHRDIVRDIFGWVDQFGNRKHRVAFIMLPRKNAKTTVAAAIVLTLLYVDDEPGAEIYAAAMTKRQATQLFGICKAMVKDNPEMIKRVEVLRDRIAMKNAASFVEVISGDAKDKDGFDAHGVVLDEAHAQTNNDLFDVLSTSVGARRQPLVLVITTAGKGKNNLAYELFDYAKKVETGIIDDPTFYSAIYAADIEDDPFSPETWAKANPGLGTIVKFDYIKRAANKAKTNPSFFNTFLQLHLNIFVGAATAWISAHDYDQCNFGPVEYNDMLGRTCYGGLDLASTEDTSALVLEFEPDETGVVPVMFWVWCPRRKIEERTSKTDVDYNKWVEAGHMIATGGRTQDYSAIEQTILKIHNDFDLRGINYDRYNSVQLVTRMDDAGVPMFPFAQSIGSFTFPTKELEKSILEMKVNHGGHPVAAWQMSNVVLKTDDNENCRPAKNKSKDKIDAIVAWIMARAASIQMDDEGGSDQSIYQQRGIINI